MRVYLANQFSLIEETRQFAKQFEASGIEVTSSWLKEQNDETDSLKTHADAYMALVAKVDVYDIAFADALVIFTVDTDTLTKRGGRHVETGIALGLGKQVVVVGPRENIFHYLPGVKVVATAEEAIEFLLTR